MTEKLRVFGVDPGPTPGIAQLSYCDGALTSAELVQCTWPCSSQVLSRLLDDSEGWLSVIGIERFVTRGRTNQAGRTTLDLVGQFQQLAQDRDIAFLQRTASQVKHWATDQRLKATVTGGRTLLELTTGMRHAKDAARHAIFTASHDGLVPDPLSKSTNHHRGARA